jgi:hypothetical protein
MVPIRRSMIALAAGACTAVRRMRMPSLVNTASTAPVHLVSKSDQELETVMRSLRSGSRFRAWSACQQPAVVVGCFVVLRGGGVLGEMPGQGRVFFQHVPLPITCYY